MILLIIVYTNQEKLSSFNVVIKEYSFDYLIISMCDVKIKIVLEESDEEDMNPIIIGVELFEESLFQVDAMKSFVFFFRKALNSSMQLLDVIQVLILALIIDFLNVPYVYPAFK